MIAPDVIGFGRSDKPGRREDHDFDRFVRWMRAFVEAINLRRATLVCQDWGGPIEEQGAALADALFDFLHINRRR